MDTAHDDHPERTTLGLGNECDIPDLEVTGIRRRTDGLYVIYSRGQVAMSLSPRQMKILLGAANSQFGHLNRKELHELVYPNRPRRQLKHPVLTWRGSVEFINKPLSQSRRASLSRSMRRLAEYGLIERCAGQATGSTQAAKSIAQWVDDHPGIVETG